MKKRFAKFFALALLPVANYIWRYWVTKKIIEIENELRDIVYDIGLVPVNERSYKKGVNDEKYSDN